MAKLERGICEITGLHFDMTKAGGRAGPFSPSLDQKIAGRGYTPENTQVVCFIHNTARGPWGEPALYSYVLAMSHYFGITRSHR